MGKAVRAIIIEEGKLLAMFRDKYGSQYFTLPGGRVDANETQEQALIREIKEETELDVISAELVLVAEEEDPYDTQYIYLCSVAPHVGVAIAEHSEEDKLNKLGMNIHKPVWVNTRTLKTLQFRTPQLLEFLIKGVKEGFPEKPTEA